MGMEFVFLNGDVRVGDAVDGSILIEQRKQGYGDGVLTWMVIFLSSIMEGSVNS